MVVGWALCSVPFAQTKADEDNGAFSPDTRWIAYTSSQSGRTEVYVQPFPVTGARYQVSRNGGTQPLWSADGKQLFFVSADGRLMTTAVWSGGADFSTGEPESLFEVDGGPFTDGGGRRYAVARDSQRFLFIAPATSRPITVSLHWTALLRK